MKLTQASYQDIAKWIPLRINGRDINKGTYGHLVVISGSKGFAGAPVMVAEAATRTGAGLVTLVVPIGIQQAIMSKVSPVVITRGLPETADGMFGEEAVELALSLASNATAVALGPGLGQTSQVANLLRELLSRCHLPMVLDADALDLLAREPDRGVVILNRRKSTTILTPHPGEMGRLLGMTTQAVQEDREGAILSAARAYNCFVVLKGSQTLIASPDGSLYLNNSGNPGMATGGSGDVLTGVIGALLAQKLEPLQAAVTGPFIHGVAGDLAEIEIGGSTGLIATDLIFYLPKAIARCQKEARLKL
jgi:hydroxyethylthiazole kinase-like uncharacterized protein yjeF